MQDVSTESRESSVAESHRVNTPAAFEIVPSGAALGAEVRGVDLSLPVPEEVREKLRAAWAFHLVLLFRDQRITDHQLMDAAAIFGPPQESAARKYLTDSGYRPDNQFLLSTHPNVSIISNLDKNGNPVLENESLGSYEVVWHTDNSYAPVPPAGSMLYALEVPINGGGDTSFSNQYRAYDDLPTRLKEAIRNKQQVHDSSRNSAGVLRKGVKLPEKPQDVEGPTHPLVRIHPVTKRPALYLGRRRVWPSNYIVGMPNEESEALLDELWAHATQAKYAWTHVWRVHDLVLWDNRCAMHYRTAIDTTVRRIMHRTVIKGDPIVMA